ncbi:tetratricopeptide repeat protein [Hankyongella ginsenosidimutans]|uniref:Tetratricopeptide repeat protein n=1 Tax=Hankyongella ginsenosidimutans TaxID=1763828 RepID=A0A4D7BSU7_9SPHN|nr:tetratricopeptide repeat protein [Hankyongella ginsenosidimutans]
MEATRASPRDFDSWHLLGYTFAALGQLADALSAYERAAALKVDHADFHNNHGNALRMLGRHEEAIKAYDRALRRAPNKAEPYYNRGMSRATLGQLEAAFSDFHTATRLAPKLAPAHYELGRVLGVFNRNAEALAAFDAALALRPQWPEAHSCRGEMLLALNRIEESRAALERALDLNPQMPVTWGLLGLVRTAAKDFPAAVSCYERSLNLHPDDPIVLSNFSNVLLALDRKDEAADACRKALALAPGLSMLITTSGTRSLRSNSMRMRSPVSTERWTPTRALRKPGTIVARPAWSWAGWTRRWKASGRRPPRAASMCSRFTMNACCCCCRGAGLKAGRSTSSGGACRTGSARRMVRSLNGWRTQPAAACCSMLSRGWATPCSSAAMRCYWRRTRAR